ncbi:GNAT family N-acetyltransferase [uncultured Jatrophihabitans sp.]|uniref:GNAT family N-acetyltransferase n=1 Tax=uncultured Jatrophihabitans sp. TaxID=1610747 RepID=UPI0035CB3636
MPTATHTSCIRPVLVGDPAEPQRTEIDELAALSRRPWTLRVGNQPMIVRTSTARDIAAVAQMHRRCSARSLLDRYRSGGRAPAVAALDWSLRNPLSFVTVTTDGSVIATVSVRRDPEHNYLCAEAQLLVEDRWQRLGIGSELMTHIAGVAQVAGYNELIAYPATAVPAAQRLMIEIGRTRMVPDTANAHLHTYLPESATLGLGSVRQRLAG